jgi:hypothetical protein
MEEGELWRSRAIAQEAQMSGIMLAAVMLCGADPSATQSAPTVNATGLPSQLPAATEPAGDAAPAKKGFFGSMRDRVFGSKQQNPAPAASQTPATWRGQPPAQGGIVQTSAPATANQGSNVVHTNAQTSSSNSQDASTDANTKPRTFWSRFQGERKKIGWTGN